VLTQVLEDVPGIPSRYLRECVVHTHELRGPPGAPHCGWRDFWPPARRYPNPGNPLRLLHTGRRPPLNGVRRVVLVGGVPGRAVPDDLPGEVGEYPQPCGIGGNGTVTSCAQRPRPAVSQDWGRD
jgi:hypothetical protein